jgi:hypothetical protein
LAMVWPWLPVAGAIERMTGRLLTVSAAVNEF